MIDFFTSIIGSLQSTLGLDQTLGINPNDYADIGEPHPPHVMIPPHSPLDPTGVLPGTLKVADPGPINRK